MIWIVLIFVAIVIILIGVLVYASSNNNGSGELIGLIIIVGGLIMLFSAGYGMGEQHGAKKQMQGGYKIEYVTDTNGIVNDTIIHTHGY